MKNKDWMLTDEELANPDQFRVEIKPGTEHLFRDEDHLPHAEMQQLLREWRDDVAQRPLWEKGVQYEDESDRMLDDRNGQQRLHERDRSHER